MKNLLIGWEPGLSKGEGYSRDRMQGRDIFYSVTWYFCPLWLPGCCWLIHFKVSVKFWFWGFKISGLEPTTSSTISDCVTLNNGTFFTARCTVVQSAVLRLNVVCLSVCSCVRLSVTLVDQDHIGWKSWKLVAWIISPTSSLYGSLKVIHLLPGEHG